MVQQGGDYNAAKGRKNAWFADGELVVIIPASCRSGERAVDRIKNWHND